MKKEKKKQRITIGLSAMLLFCLTLFAWIKAPNGYSYSERRTLAQLPVLSAKSLQNGKYMTAFEEYALDQFPLRDSFRSVKAIVAKYGLGQKDNHGLYAVDGYVSKMEYPLNQARLARSIRKLNEIQHTYIEGTACSTYLSIIPDKNYYLAPKGGYLTLDYDGLMDQVLSGVSVDRYIDIFDLLSLEDYYRTDQHWRQECILDVAERLAVAMAGRDAGTGIDAGEKREAEGKMSEDWKQNTLEYPLYGAYVGQIALPFAGDQIYYLTSEVLDACQVTSYQTGKPGKAFLYDLDKGSGRDAYEMFLSGSDPLLVIESPLAASTKELVVFRDSFGSSLIPLLCGEYAKITVVDLRYMRSELLKDYVTFIDQDVLFLYSTLVLNNTISM